MNKKIFCVLIAFVLLIQICLIFSGAHYQWKVIGIIFFALTLIAFVTAHVTTVQYRKALKYFKCGEYARVIKIKFPFAMRWERIYGYVAYMRAIAFLELGNLQQFIVSANKIRREDQQAEKQYLLLLYSLLTSNPQKAQEHITAYHACPQTENKSALDEIVRLLEQDDTYTEEERAFINKIPFTIIRNLLLQKNNQMSV